MSGTQPRSISILGADAALFKQVYDVTSPRATGNTTPILHRNRAPALLGEDDERRLGGAPRQAEGRARQARLAGWDDKVLADWNGLMIAALANAAAVFRRDDLACRRGPQPGAS